MKKDKGVIFLQNIDGFAKVCKITWIQNIVDDKSSRSNLSRFGRTALANQPLFSSLFSNSEAKSKTIAAVDQIHESFSRHEEVDVAMRTSLTLKMNEVQRYTEEEESNFANVKRKIEFVNKARFKPMNSPAICVQMESAKLEAEKSGIVKAATTVDASLTEVLLSFI
ncbi:hypothetical protein ScalyP_jg10837 [Parmales sp. scaly parma]|nr:hypothetical protein ScalyP_jg10837 [Parmales sp. scaly parma]